MARTYHVHLTFDPPIHPDTLARVKEALLEADHDTPLEFIGRSGTIDSKDGSGWEAGTRNGEAWAAWRKPFFEYSGDEALTTLLAGLGIVGHGWSAEEGYQGRAQEIEEHNRFAFGGHPRGESIVAAKAKWDADVTAAAALRKAERALLTAALTGDSEAILAAAGVYRAALEPTP